MIISASRRTDIPAFYSDWLMNRLKDGYCYIKNPFNSKQISKIELSKDVVDCIVFWSKSPKNIFDKLPIINKMGYNYYFQFTLTPYDNTIEKNLKDKKEIINDFIILSEQIGKERVLWRYDPIIINEKINIDYHKNQFIKLCEKLYKYTSNVTISFVDMYKKLKNPLISELTQKQIIILSKYIASTAKDYNLKANACCEKMDLSVYGINKASCINKDVIEQICEGKLNIKQDKNQRIGCGCVESIDIGCYNSCLNYCIYCYANNSFESTQKRYNNHDKNGEILIGEVASTQLVTNKILKSNINYN